MTTPTKLDAFLADAMQLLTEQVRQQITDALVQQATDEFVAQLRPKIVEQVAQLDVAKLQVVEQMSRLCDRLDVALHLKANPDPTHRHVVTKEVP